MPLSRTIPVVRFALFMQVAIHFGSAVICIAAFAICPLSFPSNTVLTIYIPYVILNNAFISIFSNDMAQPPTNKLKTIQYK